MGKIRLRWLGPLVAVAMVAGAATGIAQLSDNFTNHAAPLPPHGVTSAFLRMTGQNTGAFNGGVTAPSEKGAIQLYGLDTEYTSADFSPGCQDISFRKATDGTTPLLFSSLNQNEYITSAIFTEYRGDPTRSKGIDHLFQIKLSGGQLSAVHHVWASTTGPYDDVTIRPTGNLTFTAWSQLADGRPGKPVTTQLQCNAP